MCSASPGTSSLVGTFLSEDLQRPQAPGIPFFASSESALYVRDLNLTCHHWKNVCIYSCLVEAVLHAAATGISVMALSTTQQIQARLWLRNGSYVKGPNPHHKTPHGRLPLQLYPEKFSPYVNLLGLT